MEWYNITYPMTCTVATQLATNSINSPPVQQCHAYNVTCTCVHAAAGAGVLERAKLNENRTNLSDEEFDTTLHGPWMERWEITHHNRHTQAMLNNKGRLSYHSA